MKISNSQPKFLFEQFEYCEVRPEAFSKSACVPQASFHSGEYR